MERTTVSPLLRDAPDFLFWSWTDLEPYYQDLETQPLRESTVDRFLRDWSFVAERVDEMQRRLWAATTRDTEDKDVEQRYHSFLETVLPPAQQADQRVKERFLQTGLTPDGMAAPIRKMRADAEIFREENIPLETEEKALAEQYFKITGAQTVPWEGKETPLSELFAVQYEPDRVKREKAWRLVAERGLVDREAIYEVWQKMLPLRSRIANNAGFKDYRSFKWKQLKRFDYTPENAKSFDRAIETVVVPAMSRIAEKRRQRLGIETVMPWDTFVDQFNRPALRPFTEVDSLLEATSQLFNRLDPQLSAYFDHMREEGNLDIESRKNKAPISYGYPLYASRSVFIFHNFTGSQFDVEVLLHECGHAFHDYERQHLPYFHQRSGHSLEVAEVASMAMEFLPQPYLVKERGGYFNPAEASQAAVAHLETWVLPGWCLMGLVDAFQHWIYENPDSAMDSTACEEVWSDLHRRFFPFIDWSSLEEERSLEWHRILHIFTLPFYFIEYALAQMGAVQVWANARRDQDLALKQYRYMLSLGQTRSIPELYAAAGAKFAFDADTLARSVSFIEQAIQESEALGA